jgi:hypothetical protein
MIGAKMSEAAEQINNPLEEMAENNANRNPEDIAATFFKAYYPSYKLLVKKLNKKDAVRLADALVAWPLEMDEPNFFSKEAKQAFWIANQLIDCKLVMRSSDEMDLMTKANETQNADAETSANNNDAVNEGETDNG